MRPPRRLAGWLASAAVLAGMSAATVGVAAADPDAMGAPAATVAIRQVDATAYPDVSLELLHSEGRLDADDITVEENGAAVEAIRVQPLTGSDTRIGLVVVLDTSTGMVAGGALNDAKDALRAVVDRRAPNERIALVTTGGRERVVLDPTADDDALRRAIDIVGGARGRSLWDAVGLGLGLFSEWSTLQPNVVVLTGGPDTLSSRTAGDVAADAVARDAVVSVVAFQRDAWDTTEASALAARTGGWLRSATDSKALPPLVAGVQTAVQDQVQVTYRSQEDHDALDLTVTAGGAEAVAALNAGTLAVGADARPTLLPPAKPGLFGAAWVKWLGGFLGFVAVATAAYAVASLLGREESTLTTVLRPYEDDPYADLEDDDAGALAQTPLMQRAVEMTGQFAERRGFLTAVERKLEEADLALRASEAIFFFAVGAVVASALATVVTGSLLMGVGVLVLAALLPPAVLDFMVGRRKKKFLAQLPDTLNMLSGSLRAGFSLMQGIEAVSQEVSDPMGRELGRITTEARLGRPVEEAMEDAAERMKSPDFSWAIMAIRIQREVGGNLSELLVTVAETMVHRERLRRDVKALTAEGTMSAIVLGLLPFGLGAAMFVINPGYIGVLFEERLGNFLLAGAVLLAGFGFFWMKKTIEIEV